MKRFLSVGALMLGVSTAANAMTLGAHGIGQVLLYPYYTVNGGNGTLISIVNTNEDGKALKVRFHEALNGRVVADFNLYLSQWDFWVGQVFDTSADGSGAAAIATNDNSCTVPAFAPLGGQGLKSLPFTSDAYAGANADGGPGTLTRTHEGYFEVIEMGVVTNATKNSLTALTHIGGVPKSCAQLTAAWGAQGYWTSAPATDLDPPTGGLYGSEAVLNIAQGTMYTANAEAIDGFSMVAQHTAPGSAAPDLNTASKTAGIVSVFLPLGGNMIRADYASSEDAVSALFMAGTLFNEYVVDPAVAAASDWVVTLPTKRFYTDPALLGSNQARAPFNVAFSEAEGGTSCSPINPTVISREEDTPSPCVSGQLCSGYALCYGANVLTIGSAESVLATNLVHASENTSSVIPVPPSTSPSVNYNGGQLQIELASNVYGSETAHPPLTSANGPVLFGLPAFGFLAMRYINASVTPGVLANYSGDYPHRPAAVCMNSSGGSCSGGTGGTVTFSPLNPAPAPLAIFPNPINAGTGAGTTAAVTYSAVYASACSVSSGVGTPSPAGSGTCPAVSLGNTSCSDSGVPLNCSGNGTVTEPTLLFGPSSCSYTLTATCNPGGVMSSANLSVVPNGGGGDNIPAACQNLAAIGTGTAGQYWSRVLTTKVKFGDGTTAPGVDATSYVAVWSYPGATVQWPGNVGSTTRPSALVNQYFAERFIVPTDGSVAGHPNWVFSGSGINSNMSMTIGICPGDFGQTGTQLAAGCKVPMSNSSSGLTAVVSPTQVGSYCSLVPGRAYYLNILPMASLPSSNVSVSGCSGTCTPWLGVVL